MRNQNQTTATSPTSDGNDLTKINRAPNEWGYITSYGRDVHWRLVDGQYEVHDGDESKAKIIPSWDVAQNYLDGKSASL